jgi:hypothetical protein
MNKLANFFIDKSVKDKVVVVSPESKSKIREAGKQRTLNFKEELSPARVMQRTV